MPYQLVSAKARAMTIDALWEDVSAGDRDINDLLQSYRRVILTLEHTALPNRLYMNLEDARHLFGVYTGTKTVNQWLASNGNTTLPTTQNVPAFTAHPARYSDAIRAGFSARYTRTGSHPDSELPPGDQHDLLLTKPNLDYRREGEYVMVTVNGFLHRVSASEYGFHVMGGGRTVKHSGDNQIGIITMRTVSPIRYVPITQEMVYKIHPNQRYSDYAMVKMPMDLTNKVVFMVLGGYLHILDKSYYVTGERSIRIDFKSLQIVERFYDSHKTLDLSSMALTPSDSNPNQYALDDLLSDRALLAYMTLSQSFFIVMDDMDVYVRRHPLEACSIPGRFITEEPLTPYPLLSSYGRLYDYMPFKQRGKVVLATQPIYRNNYNYQTHEWTDNATVDPTRHSYRPVELPPAYLLEFGRCV